MTDPMEMTCKSCGSPGRGRVCHFCGSLLSRIESPAAEAEAIAELHVAISAAQDDPARARLIANGPLPDDRDVLIDAALRTVQLLDDKSFADEAPRAAERRVEAVCMKLRVLAAGDAVAERAVTELEQRLGTHRDKVVKEEREGGWLVLTLALLALAIIGGLAYAGWRAAR